MSKNQTNTITPAVALQARIDFANNRYNNLNGKKREDVVTKGNPNSPTKLEVGIGVFEDNRKRQEYLMTFLMSSIISETNTDTKKMDTKEIEDYINSLKSEKIELSRRATTSRQHKRDKEEMSIGL